MLRREQGGVILKSNAGKNIEGWHFTGRIKYNPPNYNETVLFEVNVIRKMFVNISIFKMFLNLLTLTNHPTELKEYTFWCTSKEFLEKDTIVIINCKHNLE